MKKRAIQQIVLLLVLLAGASIQGLFAQNVGIGTTNPLEKLDITGHVKAFSFKYASPKTCYLSIPSTAFQKQYDGDLIERYPSTVYFTTATPNSMFAPVMLPHGATITSFKIYFYDQSATADAAAFLQFYNHLGFYTSIANVSSSGSPGLGNATDNTIFSPLVNNLVGTYSIEIMASNGAWPGSDLQVAGVLISYTITETD